MKIIVISDSHGNLAVLKHVLGFAEKIGAGTIIHCGDWDSSVAVNTVLSFGIPLYSVLGNADIDPEVERLLKRECKEFERLFLKFILGGRKIGVTHNLTINYQLLAVGCDIIFCGHIHRQNDEMKNGLRVVNPGALEKGISFAIYDTDTNKVELINEQIYKK